MSANVREWLPPGAVESGAARRLVDEAVGLWSAKWFVRAEAAGAAGHAAVPGAAPRRPGGWRPARAVATAQTAAETLRLAGLALGADPEQLVLSEADRDLIGRFGAALAADLAAALEQAFGLDPAAGGAAPAEDPFGGDGGLAFTVNDRAERALLQVAIPAAALVPFLKGALPPPPRRPAPLARLGRAFEETSVRIEARLGAATLPLGELAGLAAGDVLILDRAVEDGAELAIARSGRPFAQAAIVPGESALSLLLLPQQKDS